MVRDLCQKTDFDQSTEDMSLSIDKITRSIAFYILSYMACYAQTASNYSFQKADKELREEFFKGTFWTMPTDENDVCYFQSKPEARKMAQIMAIPVLRLKDGSNQLNLEPDYSMYTALLFKQDSFLCPLYVNTYHDKQGNLKQYMTVGWNPSSDFIKHYLVNSSGWFYLPLITEFVYIKSSRFFVWDDQTASLQDYTANLITTIQESEKEIGDPKLTGIDTLGLERLTEYRISSIQSNFNKLWFFQSKDDTIQIGPAIETANAKNGINRIAVTTEGERYFIELHSDKEWISITTVEYMPFATYVNASHTATSHNELGFNKLKGYSKRLVEANVKKDLNRGTVEFVTVQGKETVLLGQRVKKEKSDYFILRERAQNVVNPKILRLAAIVIFWADTFVETQ